MYGQTEAAPRMSTLLHKHYESCGSTVGQAIPQGRFEVIGDHGRVLHAGGTGAIVYKGPNVMLGYAHTFTDLANGDQMNGTLDTGDFGNIDGDGFLTIEGRSSRVGKVFGLRVNLDELETFLNDHAKCAVIEHDGDIKIVLLASMRNSADFDEASMLNALCASYNIPRAAYKTMVVNEIPLTANGKTDYRSLQRSVESVGSA